MRVASVKYGTAVMKEDEVLLYVETCLENGSDVQDAIADMRMVDNLLYMQKLHLAVHGQVKKTTAGYMRKGTSLYNSMMSVIDGRVAGKM